MLDMQKPTQLSSVVLRVAVSSVFSAKLEVGEPCNQSCSNKLEMPDSGSQLEQSPLAVCHFDAEQILVMSILRVARQIFIVVVADGYRGLRQNVVNS